MKNAAVPVPTTTVIDTQEDHATSAGEPTLARVLVIVGASVSLVASFLLDLRGVDFLDEGYVLSLISHPEYSFRNGEPYLFGYVLHPLWIVSGSDIVYYRLLGHAVVVVVVCMVMVEAFRLLEHTKAASPKRADRVTAGLVVAASASVTMTFGVRVLAYNGLALLGVAVAIMGLSASCRDRLRFGPFLLGIGVWITFTAKPPSGAALALLVFVTWLYLGLPRGRPARMAVLGMAVGLLGSLLVFGHGPLEMARFLARGAELSRLLGGYSPLRMVGLGDQRITSLVVFGAPLLLPGIITMLLTKRRWTSGAGAAAVVVLTTWTITAAIAVLAVEVLTPRSIGREVLSVAGVAGVLAAVLLASASRRTTAPIRAVGVALILGPYIATLGTNTQFAQTIARFLPLWIVAGILLSQPNPQRARMSAAAYTLALSLGVTAIIGVVQLYDGRASPDLDVATIPTQTRFGTVLLSEADSQVVRQLNTVRLTQGMNEQTPVADLTGLAHGYVFYLGGVPLGRAATFGGFPGAVDAARYTFSRADCSELRDAWLLYAPQNPATVEQAFLKDGLDLQGDYDRVLTFRPTQSEAKWAGLTISVLRPRATVGVKLGCPS